MSMSAFAHATAAGAGLTANLVSFNVFDVGIGRSATAGVRLLSTGAQQRRVNATYTTETTWLTSGANTDFEVWCTVNSGTLTTGTATGEWLALSSSREWNIAVPSGFNFKEANITLQIRLSASPFTVLDSSTHNLDVTTEL